MFKFKTVENRTSPPTVASSVGSLSHVVFDRVFDLPRPERTLAAALGLLESSWEMLLRPPGDAKAQLQDAADGFIALAPAGSENLEKIFQGARESVTGWFRIEDPSRFDPVARELELEAEFEGYRFGGILDRLDCYVGRLEGETVDRKIWVITDYKSGAVPKDQYVDKAFSSGLTTYAWLASAASEDLVRAGLPPSVEVDLLRLVYVRAQDPSDGVRTKRVTPSMAVNAAHRMAAIRGGIESSYEAKEWSHKVGPLCGFCAFTDLCPEGAFEAQRRAELKEARLRAQALES